MRCVLLKTRFTIVRAPPPTGPRTPCARRPCVTFGLANIGTPRVTVTENTARLWKVHKVRGMNLLRPRAPPSTGPHAPHLPGGPALVHLLLEAEELGLGLRVQLYLRTM